MKVSVLFMIATILLLLETGVQASVVVYDNMPNNMYSNNAGAGASVGMQEGFQFSPSVSGYLISVNAPVSGSDVEFSLWSDKDDMPFVMMASSVKPMFLSYPALLEWIWSGNNIIEAGKKYWLLIRSTKPGGSAAWQYVTNYSNTSVLRAHHTFGQEDWQISHGTGGEGAMRIAVERWPVPTSVATVTLGNLTTTYNGTAQSATATTEPPGLAVIFTYNGSDTAPINAGSYTVVGTINDINYQGSANGTLIIKPFRSYFIPPLVNISKNYDVDVPTNISTTTFRSSWVLAATGNWTAYNKDGIAEFTQLDGVSSPVASAYITTRALSPNISNSSPIMSAITSTILDSIEDTAKSPSDVVVFKSFTDHDMGMSTINGTVTSISPVDPATTSDTNKPFDLMYGLVDMQFKVNNPGDTAIVTVFLPAPAPAGYKWFKYNTQRGWYDYSEFAVFNADRTQVTLKLTDGSMGDDDGVANGIIRDPGGLGTGDAPPASSAKSGGCFIATAAYGSYLDPHVMTLRAFRDRFLLTNPLGTAFVRLYYHYSPPVADFIVRHDSLRFTARICLLPVFLLGWVAVNYGVAVLVALLLSICVGLARFVWYRRRIGDIRGHLHF